jgi:anti-sigma factor RsiW
MSITRQNYESFFLDYLENRLTPELRQEVEAFLLVHTDLQMEMESLQEGLDAAYPTEANFLFKDALRKEESSCLARHEELLLKELDGTLSAAERTEWEELKKTHTEWQELSAYFPSTVLRPVSVSLDEKESMKFDSAISPTQSIDVLMAMAMEGDLGAEEKQRLNASIAQDPALKRSWALMQVTKLPAQSNEVPVWGHLKVPDAPGADLHTVAVAEGDVREQHASSTNKHFEEEIAIYRKLRLQPGAELYPHKRDLYRRETKVYPLLRNWAYTAAAAAVLAIAWVGFWGTSTSSSLAHRDGFRPAFPVQMQAPSLPPAEANPERISIEVPNHRDVAQEVRGEKAPAKNDTLIVTPVYAPAVQEQPLVAELPDEQPIVPTVPKVKGGAAAELATRNYMTIWQFGAEKAKSTLWGSRDYPKDSFALAWVQKEIKKRAANDDSAPVEVERVNVSEKKKTRVKLGNWEFERTRGK